MKDLEKINTTIFNIIFTISLIISSIGILVWSWVVFSVGVIGVIIAMITHYIISVIDFIKKDKEIN